jgi:Tfp pilus assembly protein PilV
VDLRNFLTSNVRIFGVSDGTATNRIILLTNSANRITLIISNGGVESAQISTPTLTAGVYKIAVGYAVNDFVLYVNGAQIGTDTIGSVPACSAVFLGKVETSSSSAFLNDRIRAAAIYPTRLTNSQLSSLTTL